MGSKDPFSVPDCTYPANALQFFSRYYNGVSIEERRFCFMFCICLFYAVSLSGCHVESECLIHNIGYRISYGDTQVGIGMI